MDNKKRRLSEVAIGVDGLSKNSKHYVYLIKSLEFSDVHYAGYTTNLKQRLETHNSGGSIHTAKYRPWKLITCMVFSDQDKAKAFENYLKSQSGRAFAKKRLL